MGGVACLYTLAERRGGQVVDCAHGDGLARGQGARRQRSACGALIANGREEHAVTFVGLVGANVGGEGGFVVDGEIGAAKNADLDIALVHQAEADGVLAAAEEALGTVDGVDGPDPALGTPRAVASVNQLQHLIGVLDGPAQQGLRLAIVQPGAVDEVPDGALEVRVVAKLRSLLLGDDGVLGEVVAQGGDDEGLGAKVADGDGGLVVLVDGALGLLVEDALGQDGGALDGQLGDLELAGVHGRRHAGGGAEGVGGLREERGQEAGDYGEGYEDSQDEDEAGLEKHKDKGEWGQGEEGADRADFGLLLCEAAAGRSDVGSVVNSLFVTDLQVRSRKSWGMAQSTE